LFRHHESLTSLSWLATTGKKIIQKFSFCFSVGGRKKFPFEKTFTSLFFCCHAKFLCPFVSTRFQTQVSINFFV
jgi:hypothetical protein